MQGRGGKGKREEGEGRGRGRGKKVQGRGRGGDSQREEGKGKGKAREKTNLIGDSGYLISTGVHAYLELGLNVCETFSIGAYAHLLNLSAHYIARIP